MTSTLDVFLEKHSDKAFFLFILLALPAFFIHLGMLPLFADEPTRANVAMEMVLSKNYAVPTVGGDYYYNKPPFYNWILAGCYLLTGNFSEFTTRLPALVPLFLYVITIYYTVSAYLSKRVALLSALLFLLSSRMLLYDSMLGHIDIFYSWITYCSFVLMYHFYRKGNWGMLFLTSYVLTAIGFLCKGLPSLVFQGFTLLAVLGYTRNLTKLFSWQHIASGMLCLGIIGAYFFNYSRYNPDLGGYLATIWDQSSQRTAPSAGFRRTLIYVFTFPFIQLGHLFPASLFVLFCFHRQFMAGIRTQPFLLFISVVFLANIWVYWLSPETRPRYLLMLYPLLIIVLTDAWYRYRHQFPRLTAGVNFLILVLAVVLTLAVPAVFFAGISSFVPLLWAKALLLFAAMAIVSVLLWRHKQERMVLFMATLILVRLGFSWFVLPVRLHRGDSAAFRSLAIQVAETSRNAPLYFYRYHPPTDALPLHHKLIFYMERSRLQPVNFREDDHLPGYYFTFDRSLNNPRARLVKEDGEFKLYRVP